MPGDTRTPIRRRDVPTPAQLLDAVTVTLNADAVAETLRAELPQPLADALAPLLDDVCRVADAPELRDLYLLRMWLRDEDVCRYVGSSADSNAGQRKRVNRMVEAGLPFVEQGGRAACQARVARRVAGASCVPAGMRLP